MKNIWQLPLIGRFKLQILIIATVFAVSACSTVYYKPLEPGEALNLEPGSQGLLVGSLSFSGNYPEGKRKPLDAGANFRYWRYNFMLRGRNEANKDFVGNVSSVPPASSLTFDISAADYSVEDGAGYIFVLPIPSGDYEFHSYGYNTAAWSYSPKKEYSIPFRIEPGVIHYVGEIRFEHVFGENIFGMAVPSGADISIIDSANRDLDILLKKYPSAHIYKNDMLEIEWSGDH